MIIWRTNFIKTITFGFARAMAIYPFILIRRSEPATKRLINHEKIHLRQQVELLLIFFYLFYLLEYLIKLIRYRKHNIAYRNISFEREAYANDENLDYLKGRPFWAFKKYL